MKILTRDKVLEEYHLPFTEVIAFAILLWTSWGLAEAFYWNKVASMIDPVAIPAVSTIYIPAFLIYVLFAAVMAIACYGISRSILHFLKSANQHVFRAFAFSLVLISFFGLTFAFIIPNYLMKSALQRSWQLALTGGLILLAILATVILIRWATGVTSRLRRSGTMMLSILVISVLLSIVRFPLFSNAENQPSTTLSESFQKLMAYPYIKPFLKK